MTEGEQPITELLRRWSGGDLAAADEVMPLVYRELRRIAAGYFRSERRDHTLQPTAVVNEAFLEIIERNGVEWQNRAHFIGRAARVMRRVLVDHAREHGARKRGGGMHKVTLVEAAAPVKPVDLVALNDALADLERLDPEKATIVELRYFGGLTIEETAEHLGVSPATVNRQWRRAKAWLYEALVVE